MLADVYMGYMKKLVKHLTLVCLNLEKLAGGFRSV